MKLTKLARKIMADRYQMEGESAEDAFYRASHAFATDEEHGNRIYSYIEKKWFMFSTPILANGGTDRGLPISCFVNYVGDSIYDLTEHQTENAYLSVMGGGIGSFWGHVRSIGQKTSRGNKTPGVIPFMKLTDTAMLAYQQGATRRGSCAAYLPVYHPEIKEFMAIRRPTGGDPNRKCLNIHHAVCINDQFMNAVKAGGTYDLFDPNTLKVTESLPAREVWEELLQTRLETGEPYLFFEDTANAALPKKLKDKGLRIWSSQLCNEIMLPTDKYRTAVCCLSSVNLETFDEWKDDELFIGDLIEMLDNVIEHFIEKAPDQMHKATWSAYCSRDLGLGAMGFHAYLLNKGVAFESAVAEGVNRKMFSLIKEKAVAATRKLAETRGSCSDVDGVRNAHLLAVAPNATSALICGTSPGVEPFNSWAFLQTTLSGGDVIKVKSLRKVLGDYGLDNDETWAQIAKEESVQGVNGLPQEVKDLFKTGFEIDQNWIVHHAAVRQQWICQGQSINLFFRPDVDKGYFNRVHIKAWEAGLKGLYYCRSKAARKTEAMGLSMNHGQDGCLSCEG